MGGNVKDAMTSDPTTMRECSYCDSEFEDEVKYGGHLYCPDCREKYDDPQFIEVSVELDLNKEGQLLTHIEFSSEGPQELNVRIPGEKMGDGIIFADVKLTSSEGDCKDVLCSDDPFTHPNLKVTKERIETIRYPEERSNEFRKSHRDDTGDLLEGEEVEVTVEFYCTELDSCTASLTVPEAVAKNI